MENDSLLAALTPLGGGEALVAAACNQATARYGLVLSESDVQALAVSRREALRDTGRVSFGDSLLPRLAQAFCGSPHIDRDNYVDTLAALQSFFYEMKNETRDAIPDDELIDCLRAAFDGRAHGELELLTELTAEELLHPEEPDPEREDEWN